MGTHDYLDDPRNADILIDINGDHKPRAEATVSVFDSAFMLGDGVWEGIRLHKGGLAFIDAHLERLYEGAKTLDYDMNVSKQGLADRIMAVCKANGMETGVHIRLMVSRGIKATPYQHPKVTITPPTIVIIPEHKEAKPETATHPLTLFTTHIRRGYSDVQDPTLNTHSKLNCIFACIQAAKAGADEALMLDPHGFVATCNSVHFFIVRKGEVWTSTGNYCLDGITRRHVLELCDANGIPAKQRNFTMTDVYNAEEAFVTGTFAGVAPVGVVDGRTIGSGQRGAMTERLQRLYMDLIDKDVAKGRGQPV